jgi:hypothetical protein
MSISQSPQLMSSLLGLTIYVSGGEGIQDLIDISEESNQELFLHNLVLTDFTDTSVTAIFPSG